MNEPMNLHELYAQVRRLRAADDIKTLIYDYAFHLDMNHPQALCELFIEDCEISYAPNFGAVGREAYAKTLEGIGTYFVGTSHHVSNIKIEFMDETSAHVRSIVYAWHRYSRERPDSHVWGQYRDEVVKVDGVWRFKKRVLCNAGSKDFHVKEANPIGRA
jgi:hypothetical protein